MYNSHHESTYNAELRDRARKLRKYGTLFEALLWNELKNNRLGFHFCRQRPIGWYIADFYCGGAALVIEIDGDSHDTKKEYDAERDELLKSFGITTLRFHDLDVKHNIDTVVHEIKKVLMRST